MESVQSTLPLYDRRRLEALVNAHKLRVHMERKRENKMANAGVKASR